MQTVVENRVTPKLRFGEYKEDWGKTIFKNITVKIGSGSTPRGGEKAYQDYGVPFIRSQNVIDNKLKLSESTFISKEINDKMKGSIVKANDILLNITGGSIGRSCVVPNSFKVGNVNQHVCIIRLLGTVSPYFLQPFLSSHKGQKLIHQGQTGSGREGLNFQSIATFKLNLPSLPEQQKIAAFLSSVDEKLQQLNKKKSLLSAYKKGVMQKIFSQELRFKDANGNNYPDWKEKKLGQISSFKNGKPHEPNVVSDGLYNLITLDSISIEGKLKVQHKKVNVDDNSLCKNDIVMVLSDIAHARLLGLCDVIPFNDKFVLNQRMGRVRLYEGNSPLFISIAINYSQNFFRRRGQGTSQKHIYERDVNAFPLQVPVFEEQQKIANFLSAIDDKIELVSTQIKNTQAFKKGLLQQMFV